MANEIESLSISIEAKATKANDAIDRLVGKLDRLSTSLGKMNTSNLNGLSNGVDKLGRAMQTMNAVKTADFTRLATNLAKLGNINVSALNSTASSLSHLTRAFNAFSGVSFDNKNLLNMINSITRLSNSNVQSLASVDFSRLGISINQLATSLSNAPKIQQSVISMTNAIANLSKSGQNIPIVASSLGSLGQSMNAFMASVSSAPNVSENVISFAQAVGLLSNSGTKAGITAKNLSSLGVGLRNLMATLSKAPLVSQNVIQMTNALANLSAQGAKVGSASNSIERGLNRASTSAQRAKKSFGGLASAIGKFYATYFLFIRAFKGIGNAIESTADYIEAFNYFTVSMGKIASKWDEDWENYGDENARNYSNKFFTTLDDTFAKLSGVSFDPQTGLLSETGLKNLGLNLQQVTQYAAQLASMMDAVGQSGETTLATTNAFVKLAGDISSLYNIDYQDAANKIRSVLQGQSRAGYGFGWDTTMAALQATADRLDLSKPVSEMAQYEKQQLRILTILEQSRVAYGDQSNTINTLANQMRIFKNNISEVGMVLGQLFVPILTKLMPIINGVTIAIKRLMANIAGFLGIKIEDTGQGFTDMGDDIDGVTDSLEDATAAAKKLKTTTLGIDELNINAPQDASGSGSGVGGGIDLTDEILEATSEYERVWNEAYAQMENRAQVFADKIFEYLEPIQNLFEDIAIGDWFAVGEDVSDIASGIFNTFANAIKKVDWEKIGKNIGNFLKGINWGKILSSVGRFIWEALNGAIDLYKGLFDTAPIETAILSIFALPAIAGFGKRLYDLIVVPLNNIETVISGAFAGVSAPIVIAVGAIVGALGYVFATNEDVRESFLDAVSAIKDSFQPAIEFVSDTVLPDLIGAFDRLVEILTPLGEFLEDAFTSVWNDMINPALSYLGTDILPGVVEIFRELWEDILVPLGTFIGDVLEPIVGILSETLEILWNSVVVPLSEAVGTTLAGAFDVLKTSIRTAKAAVQPIINVFEKLWDEILKPFVNFLWGGLKPAFESVFGAVEKVIDKVKGAIDAFCNVLEKTIGLVKDLIEKITGNVSGNLLSSFSQAQMGGAFGGISFVNYQTPAYADGGFPEDGLFFANHTELVGGFGNGRTAVANNDQIIAGIEGGVERAVARVLAPYLADIAESNREVASKDFSVNIGDRDIARANARGQRSMGYTLIT